MKLGCGRFVTSSDKEEFRLVGESKFTLWYISSRFRLISKNKKTGNEFVMKRHINPKKKNYITVPIQNKRHSLYRVVYEAFIGKVPKGKRVMCVGDEKIENLKIVDGNYYMNQGVCRKVEVNGKKYDTLKQCADDIGYSPGALCNMLNGNKTNVVGVKYAD